VSAEQLAQTAEIGPEIARRASDYQSVREQPPLLK
jgi:hypothetical protein